MKLKTYFSDFAIFILVAISAVQSPCARAQSAMLTTLHAFAGADGAHPTCPLVQGGDGNFYGTTSGGGGTNIGTVFMMTPNGTVTTLYSFTGGLDGSLPIAGLTLASDNNFYGTTSQGIIDALGGTVFRITPTGTLTTLYAFPGGALGQLPYGNVVQGTDGKLYGTTFIGGGAGKGFGAGTVFRMETSPSTPAFLHGFSGGADGGDLYSGLVQASDGNFYGVTTGGGVVNSSFPDGTGTVFQITPAGTLTTLHTFTGGADGYNPRGGLVLGDDGAFYGTTEFGDFSAIPATGGTVFRITSTGILTTLHSFTLAEGSIPVCAMVKGTDGNFYGATETGGKSNGTLFRITPTGTFTLLYTFTGGADGRQPQGSLFQGSDGSFYGTTHGGGTGDNGTVFRLDVGQTPTRLLNISTRLRVLTGNQVLIGGFIVTGTEPKRVIIRGIGPSLSGVGLTLPDPTLELHQGEVTISTNDNWKTNAGGGSQQAEIEETGIPPTNDFESALVATLDPGAYTAILAGKDGGTGVGLVEVYDLTPAANSQLGNISTRGFVDTGNNVMIGGLIVGGGTANVIVRAIGPSLAGLGVDGALADPTLELHDGNGAVIATNDNWKTRSDGSSQQAEIEATTIPPTNDFESALVAAFSPGNYTAIVRGKDDTTGVGLVEVYHLP